MNIQKFERMKESLELAKQEADRAQGKYDQLMEQLQENLQVKTLKGATNLLKKLKREERIAERKLEEAITKFEEEYGDRLCAF